MNKRYTLWKYNMLMVLAVFLSACNMPSEKKEVVLYNNSAQVEASLLDLASPGGLVMVYVDIEKFCGCYFDTETLNKVQDWYPESKFVTVIAGDHSGVDFEELPYFGEVFYDYERLVGGALGVDSGAHLLVYNRNGQLLMALPLGSTNPEVNQAQKLLLQVGLKGA